ncbi:MAG: hypothetical protein JNL62_16060 [Bryobacterales bacterium]|nr:hypothetical protein [Bryobacterales bacterium]
MTVDRKDQWSNTVDQSRWDEALDRDCASGNLDFLIEEAESESRDGLLREWPERE